MMTFPLFYLIFQVGESALLILAVQYLKRMGYIEDIANTEDQKPSKVKENTTDYVENDISFIKAASLKSKNAKLILENSVKKLSLVTFPCAVKKPLKTHWMRYKFYRMKNIHRLIQIMMLLEMKTY